MREPQDGQPPTADAAFLVLDQSTPVEFTGIVLRESRPGWIALDLPPLEIWEDRLRWVSPGQRDRITSPDFYQLLQKHLSQRFLDWKDRPSAAE